MLCAHFAVYPGWNHRDSFLWYKSTKRSCCQNISVPGYSWLMPMCSGNLDILFNVIATILNAILRYDIDNVLVMYPDRTVHLQVACCFHILHF